MCHGVCASDITGLACVMASVRQMSQVWHVSWRLSVRCHRFGMWCVRCNGFGMCHGVCASDVTGLACVMASVRQMSQVWHVSWRLCVRCHRFGMCASDVTGLACAMASVRQMSQVWHVSWRLCVRCHRFGMWCVRCNRFGMCASDVTGLCHRFGM